MERNFEKSACQKVIWRLHPNTAHFNYVYFGGWFIVFASWTGGRNFSKHENISHESTGTTRWLSYLVVLRRNTRHCHCLKSSGRYEGNFYGVLSPRWRVLVCSHSHANPDNAFVALPTLYTTGSQQTNLIYSLGFYCMKKLLIHVTLYKRLNRFCNFAQ